MKQQPVNNDFSSARLLLPMQGDISFTKSNHVKVCKYRTVTGYCNRSKRQCPAAFITFNLNN
jgi:hypothetical protein